jgi:hypothetical protein
VNVLVEVVSAGLTIIPLIAIARAFIRSRSPRLGLALAAFFLLEVRMVALILVHTVIPMDHTVEETIEFFGDFAVMSTFAATFLYGMGWFGGRIPADLA